MYIQLSEVLMIATNIRKWGNSQGLYIPKDMLRLLGVRINDPVTLSFEDGAIMIRPDTEDAKREAAFISMQKIREKALSARNAADTEAVRDYRKEYMEYLDERYNR